MSPKSAVIVGSGISALATSVRLAVKGYQVSVYEKNDYVGGKLSQFSQSGFRFDAGPSLFTMPHLVDELFSLSGRNSQDYFTYNKLDIVCKYFYENGVVFNAHVDKNKFADEAASVFGVSRELVYRKLVKAEQILDYTQGLFLEKSLHVASTYLSKDVLRALINISKLDLNTTMHEANWRDLKNEYLVQLFDRYATYNGSNPYQAPGVLNIIPALEHGQGAFLPHGGMYAITHAIYKLAKDLGVQFFLNSPVEQILTKKNKAIGLKVKGEEVLADLVVCNSDIVPAYRKLTPNLPKPRKVLEQERSSSALIFYWGINYDFKELELHNIFFSKNYKEEFDAIFKKKVIYEDPTVYVNITSKLEKSDAPEGCQNWFVMINVPHHDGNSWDARVEQAKKYILEKLERIMRVSISDKIVTEAVLTPELIEQRTSSHLGSLYGASSNNKFAAFLRHPNFNSNVKNLYYCGGSVHPGGGIPLCLLSAKIVEGLIPAN
jgi:diapolycopene oxygenase